MRIKLYECDICSCLHPWEWDGDCREDVNRYADSQDYAERNRVSDYDIDVLPMEERISADSE